HAQPENTHELLRKLLEDLQIISGELEEYINSPSWMRPAFYNDDDEYFIQYKEHLENSSNAIAPVLPTENPDNSLNKDTYTASAKDTEVQSCFLNDQLTNLSPPRNCMPPDVLLRESRQPEFHSDEHLVKDLCATYTMNIRTASNRATGANDSLKLTPSFCAYPLATRRDLFRMTMWQLVLELELDMYDQLLFDCSMELCFVVDFDLDHRSGLNMTCLSALVGHSGTSDDLSFKDIDYVEASPPDSKLVSLEEVKNDMLCEKLLNINLLIACDLPLSDDFSHVNSFEEKSMTFSNPLFDSNGDFISNDDESLSEEDVPEDDVKIYSNLLFEFDDEYISSNVNPLFDEMLENIRSKDFYDSNLDESDLLVTPFSDADKDECFDSGGDVDEINDFEDDYYDSEGDILYLESLLNDDLVHHDPSIPMMSIVSILEGIAPDLEASHARGFVHHPLELQSLAYGNLIS
nr:hypothetical protein [Tanacetum cinerariifolium]